MSQGRLPGDPVGGTGDAPVDSAKVAGDDPTTRLGGVLSAGGSITLIVASVVGRGATGAIVAAAFFAVIVGLVLRYPTLLQDGSTTAAGTPAVSSMRVAVLLVVSVFSILTLKAGWGSSALDVLKVDPSWAWILATALGGKAFQSFAEATSKGPDK